MMAATQAEDAAYARKHKRQRMEWPTGEDMNERVRGTVPATGEILEGPLASVFKTLVPAVNRGDRITIERID